MLLAPIRMAESGVPRAWDRLLSLQVTGLRERLLKSRVRKRLIGCSNLRGSLNSSVLSEETEAQRRQ